MTRLADRDDIGARRDQCAGHIRSCGPRISDIEDVRARPLELPAVDGATAVEDVIRRGERRQRLDDERPAEQALTQLVRAADQAELRVEDGDAITETLRLLQAVGGEEYRDAPL